jgi:hypothetical protein
MEPKLDEGLVQFENFEVPIILKLAKQRDNMMVEVKKQGQSNGVGLRRLVDTIYGEFRKMLEEQEGDTVKEILLVFELIASAKLLDSRDSLKSM